MQFTSHAAFLGLIIPGIIILMYLLKRRREIRVVPSTLLWLELKRDIVANSLWQRLKRNLLLFLQLAAAVLLVFALARPFLPTAAVPGRDVIVVVDSSHSMQMSTAEGPTKFALAKRAARELIEKTDQRVTLVRFASRPEILVERSGDKQKLLSVLSTLAPTHESGHLEELYNLVMPLMEGGQDLVLFTDTGFPASAPGRIEKLAPDGAIENLALLRFAVRGSKALVHVQNYSGTSQTVTVRFFAEGAVAGQREVELPPREDEVMIWEHVPEGAAYYTAKILPHDLADDPPLDNTAYFAAEGDAPLRVVLVSPGNVFLEKGLLLDEETRVFKTSTVPENPNADIIIYDGLLPHGPVAEWPRGDLVLVNPPEGEYLLGEDRLRVGGYTTTSRLLPAAGGGAAAARTRDVLLKFVDLSEVRVMRSREMVPPPGLTPVADGGTAPAILAGTHEGRRIIVIGFDLHESDFPLRPAFPIFVQNAVDWLSGNQASGANLLVGDIVTLDIPHQASSATLTTPDGQKREMNTGKFVPDEPGLYSLTYTLGDDQKLTQVFAVNLSPVETDPDPRVTDDELMQALSGRSSVELTRLLSRPGKNELWPYLAALILIILTAEWWVYHRVG